MTASTASAPPLAPVAAPDAVRALGVVPFSAPGAGAPPGEARFAGGSGRLARLRGWARRARLAPALDTVRACALIGPPSAADADALGVTLLRALLTDEGPALTTRPAAGGAGPGADEAWLLRLLEAAEAGDRASARFLVWRRIGRFGRREILFLATRTGESLRAEGAAAAAA
jgi:hypothetical protein